jgi:transposase InsO family protein
MRWKPHVRFGRRAAETDRSRDRHRAAARPHTEHPTAEGKVYCAAVLNVFSRTVVGWSIADHMRSELVVDALETGRWRRRPAPGGVVHSDRGSQGGFNWSSQHLDQEVWRWPMEGVCAQVEPPRRVRGGSHHMASACSHVVRLRQQSPTAVAGGHRRRRW